MKKLYPFILTLIFLGPFQYAFSFNGQAPIGARSAAMGRASVSETDFWSIQNNPAGMAIQSQIGAGIFYENRYLMKELSMKSGALVFPASFGVLGLSFNQFGYNLYNENKIGLAYARSFGKALRIGLQLDYLTTHFAEGYESSSNVTFELGVQSQISEKVIAGAYIFNPIKARLSAYEDERVPVILRFGLTYLFTTSFSAIAEVEKNLDLDPSVRLGMEYLVAKQFYVRAGLNTNPGILTFGAGFDIGPARIDVSAGMHQVLGTSVQAGLIFHFGKNQ